MTSDPQEMMAAYFEGKLSVEQVAELEAWLREDRDRAKAFVRQAMLDNHLTDLLHEQNVEDVATDLSDDSQFDAMVDSHVNSDPASVIDELPPVHLDANKLSRQQYASALSYVLRHTFTPKRIAYLATAAALMLGVVLAIALLTGPENNVPIAETPVTPTQPSPVVPARTTPVATLTNTHHATWAEGALAPGSSLKAGQRLTLTAGFAEITTSRGAIAIIEAPATIQLTDSDNALYLHAGKLIGLCQTESSKGFVVKTDHAEITDIGTEFGVEVLDTGSTRLQVFRGEVRAAVINQDGQANKPVAFLAGQEAHISPAAGLQSVAFDANLFAAYRGYTLLGQVRESFEPSLSLVPGQTESNDFMLLVPERKSVRLQQPLEVMMPTSNSTRIEQTPRRTLDANTSLDSYLVHFDIAEQIAETDTIILRCEILFDRPILGVILENHQLHDTVHLLANREVQYGSPDQKSGIDGLNDKVSISPDGKTLRLELSGWTTSAKGLDQVRVLVQAKSTSE